MSHMLLKIVAIVSVGAFAVASGCSDDETSTSSPSSTQTTTSTVSTVATGTGGNGGASTGGSGGAGGAACKGCSEVLINIASSSLSELCGYEGQDPQTMALMCEAGSSCELMADFLQCACVDECAETCGDNGCMGLAPSAACLACSDASCANQQNACLADM